MREVSTDEPRTIITTTPRPLKLLKEIEAREDSKVVIGSSYENRSNLHPKWIKNILGPYEGTRLGKQEIHAQILEDNPNALWSRKNLEEFRVSAHPDLIRVVVAIDPQAKNNKNSAETGIVAGGIAEVDGEMHGFVLDDRSLKAPPGVWATEGVTAYHVHKADRIVAETNNGGDMVVHTINTVDKTVPVSQLHASRGKHVRAEPVAALYEQGKIHHVGIFPELEDQLCEWMPGDLSPDRLDANVWLWTELLLGGVEGGGAWVMNF